MADIFKEVEEDLRRDKAAEWWKKYSLFIYGAALTVVIGVAGYQGWRAYDEKLRGERSDAYAAALELAGGGQGPEAAQALEVLSDPAGTGYPLLATFSRANLAAESGDSAEAERLWRALAANGSSLQAVRDLGTLFAAMHSMNEADPAVLRGELLPLSQEGAPYRFTALELLAALALREGDTATARDYMTQITDNPSAPAGARTRAAELLASLPG